MTGQLWRGARKFWNIINEIIDRKQCWHKLPTTFQYKGKSLNNDFEIANGFNDYFASIGQEMANSLPDTPGYEEYLKFTNQNFSLELLETSD